MTVKKLTIALMALTAITLLSGGNFALGSDLDDGISKYSDESIDADSKMGKTETNINFIVLEALAEAKMRQKGGETDDKNKKTNFNDGSGDNNQNSVVCEVGAQCDKVINININK